MKPSQRLLSCSCGQLSIPAIGDPIMTVSCYCHSCQTAARQLAVPASPPFTGTDGGTPFVLYRKDRVEFPSSQALREHRLSSQSSTRRVIAACCGAPMFLEFEKGHWVSVYAARIPEAERPPLEMRTMTGDAPPDTVFTDRVPSYRTHSVPFMARLLWAWVLMGFRSPAIEVKAVAVESK